MVNISEDNFKPCCGKRFWFAQCQKAYMKDVERAFGVIQQGFAIAMYPTWLKG
jgi:hypothetical protein